jgi:hypothetical protein
MSASARPFAPASTARRCPSCNSPISTRAIVCAFCDHVLDAEALAAPVETRRVNTRPRVKIGPVLRAFATRALVLVAVLALIAGGLGALFVNWMQNRFERRTLRMATQFEADRAASGWPALDSAIGAAAGAIGAGSVKDEAAAGRIASFARRGRETDRYLRQDGLPAPVPQRAAVPANVRAAAFVALPALPPRAVLDSLAGDTLDARLAPWRALARSAPLPVLWLYSEQVAELRDPYLIPDLPFGASKELASRNASAALVAYAAGDADLAVMRLRENVAAAGQLARAPMLLNQFVAHTIIRDAASLLGHVAHARGDSALVREARALAAANDRRTNGYRLTQALPAYFADPSDPRGPALVGDRALSPGQRVVAAGGVVTGYCMRARELLFGVSPDRREALRAAARQLADVEGADAMIALYGRWLDDLIERPRETFRTMGRLRDERRLTRSASRPIIGGVSARVYACVRMM